MKNFTFNDSGGNQTRKTKRWLKLLTFCMMILVAPTGFGQTTGTIQIGSGNGTVNGSTAIPVSNYVYNYSQQIVTASEFAQGGGVAGDITKIRYKPTVIGTITVWNSWTVWIGNTTKTEFATDTDWVALADMTQVFTGIIPAAVANDWFEIEFTVPFDYTGGNLVVAVHENTLGWTSSPTFSSYTSTPNSGIMYRDDTINPSPATPPTAFARVAVLPQIQFEGVLADCTVPTSLTATNIAQTTADLGWTNSGTLFDVEWGPQGFTQGTGTSGTSTTNTYQVTGLSPMTTYDFYVRQDCSGDESYWSGPFSFTTACGTVATLFENFDSYGTGNIVPDCWVRLAPVVTPGSQTITTTTPASGTRNIYQYATATQNPVIVVLPPFSNIDAGTHWLRFKARVTTIPGILHVGYVTDVTDYDSFVLLESLTINNTAYTALDSEYTVAVPTTIPAGARLAIKNQADAKSYYWDDVYWEEAPACLPPSSLTATGITSSSAVLAWTSIETGTTFDIEYGVTGFTPTGNPTDATTTGVLSNYSLTGLSSSTAYQYYVRQNCDGNGYSTWAGPFGFITTQIPVTLDYEEGFEGVHNWILSNGTQTNKWVVGEATNNGGTHAMYISNDNGVTNAYSHTLSVVHAYRDIQIPADADSVLLSFDWKAQGESCCDYLRVWVVPPTFTPTPGTLITAANSGGVQFGGNFNMQTNWTNQWYEIPSIDYAGQIARLIFEWRNDGSLGTAPAGAIDNVEVSVITCPAPSGLAVSDNTTTSAELSWSSTGTSFDIEYGVAGFTPTGVPTVSGVTNNYVLVGLSASTNYQYYVRQNCGVDGESAWIGPFNFSTLCDVITTLPYTENFDTYGTGSNGFPNCWERPVTYDNGTVWPSIVAVSANSSPNSLRFQSAVGTPTYAVSPAFAEDINNLRVKFNLRREGTSSGTIDFGVMSDPFDSSTFELVETINPTDNVFHEYLFNLNTTTLSGGNNYVAFRHNSNSNIWYYWLDDFVVELIPSCLEPTALTVTDTTSDSTVLGWISDGTIFDIEWGVADFTPSGTPTITGVANNYALTGLDAETGYEFYVRLDCGAGDLSAWSGPYYFFTGYCEVTSTSTTNGVGGFTTTGGIMNINNTSGGGSYSNYTEQSVAQFIGGEDVQFTITSANGTAGMGVWIDWNNDLDFDDPGEHVYNSAGYNATVTGTISIPAGTPIGSYRMRVVANWLSQNPTPCGDLGSAANGEAEDYTFTVIDPPTCMPPTALTALNVTADSAVLSWTSDGTLFDIKWGVPGFDVETGGTLITGQNNPYALSGLTQSTDYQYYVRQDCGVDDGLSLWAGPFTFTTTQVPVVLDYEEDFEGAHNWILSNGTQTNKWVVGEATNNGGTHSLYISNDNGVSNAYSHTLSTVHAYRDIQIPADADSILLSFDWKAQGESCCDYLRVWVVPATFTPTPGTLITAANSGGVQFGGNFNMQTNWTNQWYEVPSIDYAGQIVRLIFEWRNDGSVGTAPSGAIDNVEVSVITCPAPSGLSAGNLTLNSADISWASSGTAFNIEYGVAGFTLGSGTAVTATSTSHSLTGLTAHTSYEFYVQQDCGVDGVSAWSGPHFFHTGHCVPVSTSTSDYITSFVTTGGLPFDISNTNSGFSAGGYGNFGNMSVSHYETGSVNFTVTNNVGMGVNIWIDWNNNLEFEESEKVYASGATGTSFTGTITVPFGVPEGDYRMRVRGQWSNSNPSPCDSITWGEAEDYTFTVITPPTCLPPFTPTAINASATSVSLAWQSNGDLFDIEYGPTGFTPGTGTTIPGVGNPYTLGGLTGGTTYDFYVRQDCGEDDGYSMWNGPVTFTPGVFEGDIPTLLNANPQVEDIACATSFSIDVPEGQQIASLTVEYIMISIDPAWTSQQRSVLYSSTLGMGEPEVVTAGAQGENYPGIVAYNREVTFANGATGTVAFELKAWRTSGGTGCSTQQAYVMDGSWILNATFEPIPTCPNPPTDLGYTNITEDSVDLIWEAEPGTFQIKWGTVGFNTETEGTTISDITTNSYNLSGLDASIAYEFYVRRDCSTDDGEDFGEWAGPFKFNAGYCLPTSTLTYHFSQFNTSEAINNIIYSNSGGGTGYVNNTNMIVTVNAGESFDFTSNYVGGPSGLKIWIDWNKNFIFEEDEEVFELANNQGVKTGTIAIPADAINGEYRMRVRAQQEATSIPPACGVIDRGQALDFTLEVQGGVNSTSDFNSFAFAYYPNPVGEMLYLKANTEIDQVTIYNMLGQQLRLPIHSGNTQIDMTGLPAGNYVMSVTIEGINKTFKVVKK